MKIILGSSSPWRKAVLERTGLQFEVTEPNLDEKSIRHPDPETLTMMIAMAKMQSLLPQIDYPAIVLTYDQVMHWNGKVQEKPQSEREAREMVSQYHLYRLNSFTAIVAINTQTFMLAGGIDWAQVIMRKIPDDVISAYVQEDDAYSNAGALAIEHPLLQPYVLRIHGGEDSIQGMPIALTSHLIQQVQNTKTLA